MSISEQDLCDISSLSFRVEEHPLIFLRPLLEDIVSQVSYLFSCMKMSIDIKNVTEDIKKDLKRIWLYRLQKIFVLELYQAKKSGFLKGKTSEARYQFFVSTLLKEKNCSLFFQRYPVLKKQWEIFSKNYIDYWQEFGLRLEKDKLLLKKYFKVDPQKSVLHSIQINGDPHHYFRRVVTLKFLVPRNKNFISIVYKPRPVGNEICFNQFIRFLNPFLKKSIKTYLCIDKNKYGWCEFIEKMTCTSERKIKTFYYRFGELIAITYALNIQDIHYENLIACGDNPVIIDLECFGFNISELASQNDRQNSVLSSGMLPSYMVERNSAMDFSAFGGGGEECEIPFENVYPVNLGRDDMRIERKSGFFSLQDNRPTLHGKSVVPYHYKEDVCKGFSNGYDALFKQRKYLLEKLKSICSTLHVRLVFRSTSLYTQLIRESYHPFLLRNINKYKSHINWLKDNHAVLPLKERVFKELVESEINQIKNQDIPFFYLAGHMVYDAYGNKLHLKSKLSLANSIEYGYMRLSQKDFQLQFDLSQKILDTYLVNNNTRPGVVTKHLEKDKKMLATNKVLMKKAMSILNKLIDFRLDKKEWTWIQHRYKEINNKSYWILSSSNISLYTGSLGIFLVLSYAYRISHVHKYRLLVFEGIIFLSNYLRNFNKINCSHKVVDLSLFEGIGGILYFCIHSLGLGFDKKIQLLIKQTMKFINKHFDAWLAHQPFDIIAGLSGLMIVLDLLRSKKIVYKLADRLIHKSREYILTHYKNPAKFPAREQKQISHKPLLGFSHGVSGIAYALYRTENLKCPDKRVIIWIKKALTYERSCFDLKNQNWPNYLESIYKKVRNKDQTYLFQSDWCHGALGIGLMRLELRNLGWQDNYIDQEILTSIQAVKKAVNNPSMNLCHGSLGKFDFYLRIRKENLISKVEFDKIHNSLSQGIVNNKELATELQPEIFIPGLMTGQAGLVYSIFRMLYPETVPSILTIN